jgi:hypothetical protein
MVSRNGNRSGIYRVNGEGEPSMWAFVSGRIGALAVICGSLVTVSGAAMVGARTVQYLQRPQIESVAREVIEPYEQRHAAESQMTLGKAEFNAYVWKHEAQDSARDDQIREMREDLKYIRERLDRLVDAETGRPRR